MKTTFKIHLAKQQSGKEDRLNSECGKNGNRYGALRVAKSHEFFLYDIENQCEVCLGRAKELGINWTNNFIDQD